MFCVSWKIPVFPECTQCKCIVWSSDLGTYTRRAIEHHENTPIQIYRKNSPPKAEKFQIKKNNNNKKKNKQKNIFFIFLLKT